jgi:periplasmic divalent cation tolerance protein
VCTTINDPEQAEQIARTLLEARLVACVNVLGPCISLYPWQGKLARETEYLLLMKTTTACEAAVITRLQEIHPYEIPEVIVLPIEAGSPTYLSWLAAAVQPPSHQGGESVDRCTQ